MVAAHHKIIIVINRLSRTLSKNTNKYNMNFKKIMDMIEKNIAPRLSVPATCLLGAGAVINKTLLKSAIV